MGTVLECLVRQILHVHDPKPVKVRGCAKPEPSVPPNKRPYRNKAILFLLADCSEQTTHELADMLDTKTSNAQKAVRRLHDSGFVELIKQCRVRGCLENTWRITPLGLAHLKGKG